MLQENTVKAIIKHPYLEGLAYTFKEDDSFVHVNTIFKE